MSTGKIVAIAVLVVVALVGVGGCMTLVSVNNTCVSQEAGIKAQYEQNQNNYDNYFKKLLEASQVASMYAGDMKKIYDGVMTGRYGPNGSQAMMQWIKEKNPNVDASLYKKLQSIIEAGRNSFEADQKSLIDKKRAYEVYTKSFPNSLVAGMFGYPKIDMNKYGIVTSDETQKAFDTKKSDPINIRPPAEK